MSTTTPGTSDTAALERNADRAREALAQDIHELQQTATRGADVVAIGGRDLAIAAAMTGALALAGTFLAGRGILRAAGRASLGIAAGVAAGLAMTGFQSAWSAAEERLGGDGPPRGAEAISQRPATVKAAEAVVGELPEGKAKAAGSLAHYAMSGVTGAIYAAARDRVPPAARARGLAYGALVWLVADETMVPLLGLSDVPWHYSARTHVRALLAHLVYGAVLDGGLELAGYIRSMRR